MSSSASKTKKKGKSSLDGMSAFDDMKTVLSPSHTHHLASTFRREFESILDHDDVLKSLVYQNGYDEHNKQTMLQLLRTKFDDVDDQCLAVHIEKSLKYAAKQSSESICLAGVVQNMDSNDTDAGEADITESAEERMKNHMMCDVLLRDYGNPALRSLVLDRWNRVLPSHPIKEGLMSLEGLSCLQGGKKLPNWWMKGMGDVGTTPVEKWDTSALTGLLVMPFGDKMKKVDSKVMQYLKSHSVYYTVCRLRRARNVYSHSASAEAAGKTVTELKTAIQQLTDEEIDLETILSSRIASVVISDALRVPVFADCPLEMEAVDRIVDLLMDGFESSEAESESEEINILGIVGDTGIGKTVLAQMMGNTERVKSHFIGGIRYLVVGRNANVVSLQRDLLKSLTGKDDESQHDTQWYQRQIEDNLRHNFGSCLTILDDVWNVENAVQLGAKAASSKSQFLLTSRKQDVVAGFSDAYTYEVDYLDMEYSKQCLMKKADLGWIDEPCDWLLDFCSGLIIALSVVGAMARMKSQSQGKWGGSHAWYWVRKELEKKSVAGLESEVNPYDRLCDALQVSIETLGESKDRFLDLSMFPEDELISCSELKEWWYYSGHSKLSDDFDDWIDAFHNMSLINREGHSIRLHDLVVKFIQKGDTSASLWHKMLPWLMSHGYPVPYHPNVWMNSSCSRMVAFHARKLIKSEMFVRMTASQLPHGTIRGLGYIQDLGSAVKSCPMLVDRISDMLTSTDVATLPFLACDLFKSIGFSLDDDIVLNKLITMLGSEYPIQRLIAVDIIDAISGYSGSESQRINSKLLHLVNDDVRVIRENSLQVLSRIANRHMLSQSDSIELVEKVMEILSRNHQLTAEDLATNTQHELDVWSVYIDDKRMMAPTAYGLMPIHPESLDGARDRKRTMAEKDRYNLFGVLEESKFPLRVLEELILVNPKLLRSTGHIDVLIQYMIGPYLVVSCKSAATTLKYASSVYSTITDRILELLSNEESSGRICIIAKALPRDCMAVVADRLLDLVKKGVVDYESAAFTYRDLGFPLHLCYGFVSTLFGLGSDDEKCGSAKMLALESLQKLGPISASDAESMKVVFDMLEVVRSQPQSEVAGWYAAGLVHLHPDIVVANNVVIEGMLWSMKMYVESTFLGIVAMRAMETIDTIWIESKYFDDIIAQFLEMMTSSCLYPSNGHSIFCFLAQLPLSPCLAEEKEKRSAIVNGLAIAYVQFDTEIFGDWLVYSGFKLLSPLALAGNLAPERVSAIVLKRVICATQLSSDSGLQSVCELVSCIDTNPNSIAVLTDLVSELRNIFDDDGPNAKLGNKLNAFLTICVLKSIVDIGSISIEEYMLTILREVTKGDEMDRSLCDVIARALEVGDCISQGLIDALANLVRSDNAATALGILGILGSSTINDGMKRHIVCELSEMLKDTKLRLSIRQHVSEALRMNGYGVVDIDRRVVI